MYHIVVLWNGVELSDMLLANCPRVTPIPQCSFPPFAMTNHDGYHILLKVESLLVRSSYTLHFPLSSCNWETSQRKPQTYFKLNHSGQPKSNPILQQPALWILIKVKLFLKDLQIFRSFCHDSWCRPKRLQLKAQPPGSFEGCIGSFKATRLGKWPKISNIPKNIHIYKTYTYKSEWSWTAGIWSY